jgi:hypothetical protein
MPLNAVERLKSMKKKQCLLPITVVDSHTCFMLHWMQEGRIHSRVSETAYSTTKLLEKQAGIELVVFWSPTQLRSCLRSKLELRWLFFGRLMGKGKCEI